MKPDVCDGLVVVGLALIGYGLAQWSVPAAMVVLGLMLVIIGVTGAVRKGHD